ncbi:hypothetical protein SDC9_129695 [bioreactor metagenome]|uniref:Uncharacterized protein n=1 Tax=bioreactor metagenome TaxID=1076179 RepID=A0A645D0L1_9ZZZZ
MAKETHHLFDGIFHAVELGKRGVAANDLVGKQTRELRVISRVHHLRLADGCKHALCGALVDHGVTLTQCEVLVDRHFLFTQTNVAGSRVADDIHTTSIAAPRCERCRKLVAQYSLPNKAVVAPCKRFE